MYMANLYNYTPGMAFGLYNKAYIARYNHEYAKSIDYLFRALDMVEGNKDYMEVEARIVREIANVYGQTENYGVADEFYSRTIDLVEALNNQHDVAIVLHNRGLTNYYQGKYDNALDFALLSMAKADSIGDPFLRGIAFRLLGQIYRSGFRDYERSLEYLGEASDIFVELNNVQSLGEVMYEEGCNYISLGQLEMADSLLKASEKIAHKLRNPFRQLKIYNAYSLLEEEKSNYAQALTFERQARALEDSIQGLGQYWDIARRQSQYDSKETSEALDYQRRYAERQTTILILVIVFTLGLSILAIMAYRASQLRKRSNRALREKNDQIEAYNVELSQKNEEIAAQADWLRQTNEKMETQKNELTQLNRMKDRMISVISHDFRSPLNSLRGALMLLNSQQLPPDQLQMVINDINNKLNRTLNLVDNLLQWTRNQIMGVEVNPEPINMYALTEETIHLLHPLAEDKNITLENAVNPDAIVSADLEMLKVVIRNLVSNAIKFTLKGGTVSIISKWEERYLSISVKDTGIGMTPDRVDRLFHLSTDRTTLGTANEKGTGIGLLLCKEFIEKHGGHIVVRSTENKGTTFTFSLPLGTEAFTKDTLVSN